MKILFTDPSTGRLAILVPNEELGWTAEQHAAHAIPAGVVWHEVADDAIPNTREWRGAWVHDGTAIVIDMTKAKAITADRLRRERKPLLEALDVEQLRELAQGRPVAVLEARKQRLRDLPQAVDQITTLDELSTLKAES